MAHLDRAWQHQPRASPAAPLLPLLRCFCCSAASTAAFHAIAFCRCPFAAAPAISASGTVSTLRTGLGVVRGRGWAGSRQTGLTLSSVVRHLIVAGEVRGGRLTSPHTNSGSRLCSPGHCEREGTAWCETHYISAASTERASYGVGTGRQRSPARRPCPPTCLASLPSEQRPLERSAWVGGAGRVWATRGSR